MKKTLFLSCLCLLLSAGLRAQISTVGATQASANPGASQWSVQMRPTAGDTLLVGCDFNVGTSFNGVSDTVGDAFAEIGPEVDSAYAARAYIATNVKGGTTTVSCKASSGVADNEIYVTELKGVAAASPVDTFAATAGPTSPATASVTTSHAGDLVWAYVVTGHATNPSGWTALSTYDGNLVSSRAAPSVGTVNTSISVTMGWTLFLIALEPGSAPISVSVSPSSSSVQVSQSTPFTATLQNDTQNQGVTWSLSGSGCVGSACGTLTNIAAKSVTYNAPASVPSPAAVTLKATSVADASKSASAAITITPAPLPISVSVNPTSASVQVSQTAPFSATVSNDSQNKGVTWALSGSGCSGSTCGILTNVTATAVTYNAPSTVPSPASVTLTATSVSDTTRSASAAITVTPAPLPISVSVSPTPASVQVSQTAPFSATVSNDGQNKGVTWALSGSGCSGSTCGTLTNITATSVTYNAPATVPSPASVTLIATSVTDTTKSASAAITITPAPLPISVSVNPTSASVQISQTAPFSATINNDSQNKGVTWALSGSGCSGSTCGTLTDITATSVTYNAPSIVPSPAGVTLIATSVTDTTKSASAAITITPAPLPISVSMSPTSSSVQVSQTAPFSVTVSNDGQNKGVTWSLSGSGCSGSTCGTLTNVTTTSATYNAPATVPSPAGVTLIAISVADATKSASAAITITPAPLPISVGVSPTSASVQVSQTAQFSASVNNDDQDKGVTWSLSGVSCSGTTCGTLTSVTTTSVTYNAPSSVPSSVILTATSASDSTKSASATITVTPPTPTAPGNLAANATEASQIGLTWSASTDSLGIASYLVERCQGAGCSSFSQIASIASTSYSDATVAASTTYSYRVRASDNDSNVGPYSNTALAITPGASGVPTLVWSKSSANSTGVAMNTFTSSLPTSGTLPGNVLIATFQYASDVGASAQATDDQGDTLSLVVSNDDGRQVLATYCVIPAPGTRALTISFSGGMPEWVSMVNASEWYNLTCSVDDSPTFASSASPAIATSAIATSVDGDLIYQAAIEDYGSDTETWSDSGPWALLSAEHGIAGATTPQAAQYQVQATHGSINPTLSMETDDFWNTVAVALKPAVAGMAPPAGIRIVHMQEESILPGDTGPFLLQFPSSGNLIISATNDGPAFDVSAISDSNGNSYTQIGTPFFDPFDGGSGDVQTFYAANAVTSTDLSITYSMTGDPNGGSTFFLYDVTGAASSPYDAAAGRSTATDAQPLSDSVAGPTITPSKAGELVITQIGVASNSIVNLSPGYFTATIPDPLEQTNNTNENNGWGFDYSTSPNTPKQYIWSTQGGPVFGWASTAVAFMAP